jgi:hypothetical protein
LDNLKHILFEQSSDPLTEKPGLRNAWQWLAMLTMTLDHIGYLYYIPALRWPGRLGMPLYAILFVITIRKHQVHFVRILVLAALSQVQYMYIFQQGFYVGDFQLPQLNIIFGFAIFAWMADGVNRRQWWKIVSGFLMMWVPMSYGWYLYATLATFYWLNNKYIRRSVFAVLTTVYTYLSMVHPRQLLAIIVPFLTRLKAPRPNKYLYRYFYPGHLLILAAINYWALGTPFSLPFGKYSYQPEYYQEYYQTEPYDYYYDVNDFDGFQEGIIDEIDDGGGTRDK